MTFVALLFFRTMLIAQLPGAHLVAAATEPPPQPAQTTSAQATPAQADPAKSDGSPSGLLDAFGRSRLGQIAQGKKAVTWQSLQEMRDPAFWLDSIKDLVLALLLLVPRILIAVLFLVVFYFLYRGIRKLILGSIGKSAMDASIRDMLGSLIKWGVMGFGLIIACNQVGIQITALLAGVSVVGLAIGFAAQETLANFIAGIVIFWDKPFTVGDWVTVHDTFAQVQRVTFRSTRLLTGNGEMMVLPNTSVLSNKLVNHSTHPLQRVNVPISIAYKESIDEARAVLLALVQKDQRILSEPAPSVNVKACADSSVNLVLHFWISDESMEGGMMCEYLEKAKNALDRAGISIPFPHLQVLLEETAALRAVLPKAA
jgi:small conductance mechanosensitive channel